MQRAQSRLSRLRGALMLAGEAVDHLGARIHEFHRAISDLPFTTLGAVPVAQLGSQPVRVIHDGITDGVYDAIRGTARVLFQASDVALRELDRSQSILALPAPAALATPPPAVGWQDDVVAALSGAVGDHMASRRNPLAIRFGVYHQGRKLGTRRESLSQAYPDATGRIAVFVHGLCGNENVWQYYRQEQDPQSRAYGDRLAEDLGFTPVYLRYNSGLHISHNGGLLARMLADLHAHWPCPVQEIALIGHSMGGLVSRSAVEIARRRQADWLGSLSQLICLGSPHLGAPLERVVHLATSAMAHLPLSRPLARLLDSRSLGIKDLRWGYTLDEEWRGHDPDAGWAQDRQQYAPVPGLRYRFLGTCLHEDPDHPVSRLLGDGLVQVPSSLATDVAGAEGALRVALHHFRLLNHPDVYARLHGWLQDSSSG